MFINEMFKNDGFESLLIKCLTIVAVAIAVCLSSYYGCKKIYLPIKMAEKGYYLEPEKICPETWIPKNINEQKN